METFMYWKKFNKNEPNISNTKMEYLLKITLY